MAQKPKPKPAATKTIKFGDLELPIVSADIQPVSADLITEVREHNGIVAISFGTINCDVRDPEVTVCARLRMTLASAADLRRSIDNVLTRATAPKAPKSGAH